VWPEYELGDNAGRILTNGLEALRSDHESGARELAVHAVTTLRGVISEMAAPGEGENSDAWWAKVCMAAWHLWKNGRESMDAAIVSSLVTVLSRIETALKEGQTSSDAGLKLQRVLAAIEDHLAAQEAAVARISDSFVDYVGTALMSQLQPQKSLSILTLSSSSTIPASLIKAAAALDVSLDLRILESRPLCEGVTLASKLVEVAGNQMMKITLYSDASAAIAANGVDMILVGADRISASGDVSNKTGTLPAVLSTRSISPQAKVVVLSGIDKIAGPGAASEHVVEENDPRELTRAWKGAKGANVVDKFSLQASQGPTSVAVKNIYFEWVPASLVDVYITEEGSWSAGDIQKRSEWIGQEVDRFFADL
jgi:translation initiation factor 2B subunit (eIF-2B alpha/beta/delta family)